MLASGLQGLSEKTCALQDTIASMVCIVLSEYKWLLNFKKCALGVWVNYLLQTGKKSCLLTWDY